MAMSPVQPSCRASDETPAWFAAGSWALSNRRVESIEQRQPLGERLLVVLHSGQEPAQDKVEPARLFAREFFVAKISLVDDLGNRRQAAVAKSRAVQQGLEGAVISVVAELDAGHVEGDGARRHLIGSGKVELGLRVEKALDEPGGGDAVHVRPRASDPS